MAKKKIVITINSQTTEAEGLRMFRAIPRADVIKEVDVQWAGTWLRSVFEKEGKLKPRKK